MDNILSLLNNYTLDNADDIAKALADDFRKRRIEKNLTREQVAVPYPARLHCSRHQDQDESKTMPGNF